LGNFGGARHGRDLISERAGPVSLGAACSKYLTLPDRHRQPRCPAQSLTRRRGIARPVQTNSQQNNRQCWTVGTKGLAPLPKRASIERTRRQNGFSRKVSTACRHATENSIGHPAGIQRGVSHEGVLFSVRLFAVTAQLVRKDQMSIYGWVPTMFACAV